jgi:hypothetical protein
MKKFIYPTWTRPDNEWVKIMLNDWRKSGKPYLSFPWIKFRVWTLPVSPFWMYMYYSKSLTTIPDLIGKMEFRLRIVDWSPVKYDDKGDDIYLARKDEEGKIWFKCKQYQEVRKTNHDLISLDDFVHASGKNLVSTIRNSIPQVECQTGIKVIRQYP